MNIGIFGGTFNPPHLGHLEAAKAFIEQAKLDKLLVIPSNLPPHKAVEGEVTANNRLKMAKIAFSSLRTAEVSDTEIKRGGVSYTKDTLLSLSNEEDRLFLLCGTDMFLTLDSWFCPEIIFASATVCYVQREPDAAFLNRMEEKAKEYQARFHASILPIINPDVVCISSTELREKLKNGESIEGLLSPSVFDYIRERGLYR